MAPNLRFFLQIWVFSAFLGFWVFLLKIWGFKNLTA